jgi:hypothetical protein
MRIRGTVRLLAIAGVACSMALAACSSSTQSSTGSASNRVQGGTATLSLTQTDGIFNYIFPLLNFDNDTFANITYSQYLMWRPLYWFGSPVVSG